jgi:hypothetical protein
MRSLAVAVQPFTVWLLSSLLAITLIGDRPYAGLTVALLGGLALGWSSLFVFPAGRPDAGEGCSRDAGEE